MADRELELSADRRQGREGIEDIYNDLMDVIDWASDQDGTTWLTSNGKRIAKIAPVDEIPARNLNPAEQIRQDVLTRFYSNLRRGEDLSVLDRPDVITRLAQLLSLLGALADAPGVLNRDAASIEKWLRTGGQA